MVFQRNGIEERVDAEEISSIQQRMDEFCYGCDTFGRLKSVLVHTPGEELSLVNDSNFSVWLFDFPPDRSNFRKEHEKYCELLLEHGVTVYQLKDHVKENIELTDKLPNLTYLHDTAVITRNGAVLSGMAFEGRKREEIPVREALLNLGIPVYMEFGEEDGAFEGCLIMSEDTMLVSHTERHSLTAIQKFIHGALNDYAEIIYVNGPRARRFMHPDTIFNRVTRELALYYPPAFNETYLYGRGYIKRIDIKEYMQDKGVELMPVSEDEQKRLACSFVPLESGVILHYDTALDRSTVEKLENKGVEFVFFHPEALVAGGGSLRCLTLRLHRE